MTTPQQVDYILVGQGLAGSAVAMQLIKAGLRILVIDDPAQNTSSRIAAGLFNPITGRKMVKTWLADKLFPYLHNYYRGVEALSGEAFFHPMPLYRPFVSVEEQNEWMAKSGDDTYAPYIDTVATKPMVAGTHDPFGGLVLKQCGYLDTVRYIGAVARILRHQGMLLQETFDGQALTVTPDRVMYKHVEAAKIIFCTGVHGSSWFNWLPLRPLKGETIRIKSTAKHEAIINRGVYIVPADVPGEWRVGATYNFQDKAPGTTDAARQELMQRLGELVTFPFDVTGQEWGFRPTTPDRRPLAGVHPEMESVMVFNGLGTKGVSLAPYFSEVLIHSLQNKVALNKEIDIERYKSLYWSSPK